MSDEPTPSNTTSYLLDAESPAELERLYTQILIEMHADSFGGMWHFMMFWATKPA